MKLSDTQFGILFLSIVLLFLMIVCVQGCQVHEETFRLCIQSHAPLECGAGLRY